MHVAVVSLSLGVLCSLLRVRMSSGGEIKCTLKVPEWLAEDAEECPEAVRLFGGPGPGSAEDQVYKLVGNNGKDMPMYGHKKSQTLMSFYYSDTHMMEAVGGVREWSDATGFWVFHSPYDPKVAGEEPPVLAVLAADVEHWGFMPPERAEWLVCGKERTIDVVCKAVMEEADLHTTSEPGVLSAPCGESRNCDECLVCALPRDSLFITYEARCKFPEDVDPSKEIILERGKKGPVGPYENCFFADPDTPCNLPGWICQKNENFKNFAWCVPGPRRNAQNVKPLHSDFKSPQRILKALSREKFAFEQAEGSLERKRRRLLKECAEQHEEDGEDLGSLLGSDMSSSAGGDINQALRKRCSDQFIDKGDFESPVSSSSLDEEGVLLGFGLEDSEEDDQGDEVDGWGGFTSTDCSRDSNPPCKDLVEAAMRMDDTGLDAETGLEIHAWSDTDRRRLTDAREDKERRRRLQSERGQTNDSEENAAAPESAGWTSPLRGVIELGDFDKPVGDESSFPPTPPVSQQTKTKKKNLGIKCGPKIPITKRAPSITLAPSLICSYLLILAPSMILAPTFLLAPSFAFGPSIIMAARFLTVSFWGFAMIIFGAPVYTNGPIWSFSPELFLAPATNMAPLVGTIPTIVLAPIAFFTVSANLPDIFEDWVFRRTDFKEDSKVKRFDNVPVFQPKDAKVDTRSFINFVYTDVFPVNEVVTQVQNTELPTVPVPQKVAGSLGFTTQWALGDFFLANTSPSFVCPRFLLEDPTGGPVPRVQVFFIVPYDFRNGKVFSANCTIPYPSDVLRDVPHMPRHALKAIQVLEGLENLIPPFVKIAGLQALSFGEVVGEGQIPDLGLWLKEWTAEVQGGKREEGEEEGRRARRVLTSEYDPSALARHLDTRRRALSQKRRASSLPSDSRDQNAHEGAEGGSGSGRDSCADLRKAKSPWVQEEIFAYNMAAKQAERESPDGALRSLPSFFGGSKVGELVSELGLKMKNLVGNLGEAGEKAGEHVTPDFDALANELSTLWRYNPNLDDDLEESQPTYGSGTPKGKSLSPFQISGHNVGLNGLEEVLLDDDE